MAIKRLLYIFIPVLSVFLMSHNVNAITLSSDVDLVQTINQPYYRKLDSNNNWTGWTNTSTAMDNNSATIKRIQFRSSSNSALSNVKKDDYVVFTGWMSINQSALGGELVDIGGYYTLGSEAGNCDIILLDHNQQQFVSGETPFIRYGLSITCRMINDANMIDANIYFRSNTFGISGAQMFFNFNSFAVYRLSNSQKDIADAINEQNEKQNQSVDNIDNQQTDDIDSGDNTNMVNFIGQISNLFTQIGDIPAASQCVINGDFGNLDIGNINLCTGKDKMPFVVNFFSIIFVSLVSMGLAFYLVNRVLSLYSWARSSSS